LTGTMEYDCRGGWSSEYGRVEVNTGFILESNLVMGKLEMG
jgi:hypothetical protein